MHRFKEAFRTVITTLYALLSFRWTTRKIPVDEETGVQHLPKTDHIQLSPPPSDPRSIPDSQSDETAKSMTYPMPQPLISDKRPAPSHTFQGSSLMQPWSASRVSSLPEIMDASRPDDISPRLRSTQDEMHSNALHSNIEELQSNITYTNRAKSTGAIQNTTEPPPSTIVRPAQFYSHAVQSAVNF